jgi:hypothetical protein
MSLLRQRIQRQDGEKRAPRNEDTNGQWWLYYSYTHCCFEHLGWRRHPLCPSAPRPDTRARHGCCWAVLRGGGKLVNLLPCTSYDVLSAPCDVHRSYDVHLLTKPDEPPCRSPDCTGCTCMQRKPIIMDCNMWCYVN